jgi:endonuclease/exonuclease/phosphatase family metal-dependent hydrolase
VAVAATVHAPGLDLTVACTHLSFVPWWNGRQLHALVAALETAARPLVLMGDLNLRTRRAVAVTGMTPVAAHPTFPAGAPREQLDHILVDGELAATRTDNPQLPLSDHRALVADLTRGQVAS